MSRSLQKVGAGESSALPKFKNGSHTFRKQLPLQLFVLAGVLYLFIFSYIPMFGIIMGFKKYDIIMGVKGIFTSEWVGFKYFIEFFNDYNFNLLMKNTILISVLKMVFTFPLPIVFAIIINEIRMLNFKKLTQTCSYLPHFISWVVISGISFRFFSNDGIINTILHNLKLTSSPVPLLTEPNYFWGLIISLDIWKELGWWAIIFLAAITGVSSDIYESATIDGASRLKRIWYITLPCIKPTIVVVLILALGNLFGGGLSGSNFEQCYLLGNRMNRSASDIIQTYVFKIGLAQGRYAYATAVGLIQSVISLVLILMSNFIAKRVSGSGLF